MALKNAYSKMPIDRIFGTLQKILVEHEAKQITFDYGKDGKIYGLTFVIEIKGSLYPIKTPARIEKVRQVLEKQGFNYDDEQVYRVAWRNVLSWIEANMAFIDIGGKELAEVFLSDFVDESGQTLFDRLQESQFKLGSGNLEEGEVTERG